MICLLEGHKPQVCEGVGDNTGKTFTVCAVCNKMMDVVEDDERESSHLRLASVNGDYR